METGPAKNEATAVVLARLDERTKRTEETLRDLRAEVGVVTLDHEHRLQLLERDHALVEERFHNVRDRLDSHGTLIATGQAAADALLKALGELKDQLALGRGGLAVAGGVLRWAAVIAGGVITGYFLNFSHRLVLK